MTANMLWIRIFDLLGSGCTFLVMAAILVGLARHKAIGHRSLLIYSAVFCLLRSLSSFAGAWDLYAGVALLAFWFRTVSAIYGVFYGCVCFAAKDDLLITLRTTEYQEELRRDLKRDMAQIQMNRDYLSETNLITSCRLVREQKRLLGEKVHT